MLNTTLKILETITNNGYEAYIVGGFVRDYLMNIKSNDVDITTNATPKELINIFPNASCQYAEYGSVVIYFKDTRFEITTYREEENYEDLRHPDTVSYVDDLKTDLKRRDFLINTICMDKNGKVLDLLNGKCDIDNKLIRTVISPDVSFKRDALRILRAVRFATTLGFSLSDETILGIKNNKHLLKHLSFNRKKEELNKIFGSNNIEKGISLIKELDLVSDLDLKGFENIKSCSQVIGVWASLDVDTIYPFTRNEHTLMKNIRLAMKCNLLDMATLYQYGLYVCTTAGELLGIDNKKIVEVYMKMPIYKRSNIVIDTHDILDYLKIEEGPIISEIWKQLELALLNGEVNNEKKQLLLQVMKIYTSLQVTGGIR